MEENIFENEIPAEQIQTVQDEPGMTGAKPKKSRLKL